MTQESITIQGIIKCRKPKPIKSFGIASLYERYTNRYYKWRSLLPNNEDRIKITWVPGNILTKNAYIGMEGIVESMDTVDGNFALNCGTSILLCHGNFDYIKL